MKTMIEYVHDSIKDRQVNIAIDFTMGNGNDTLFLSQVANHVYSFDIQEIALVETRKKIGNKDNVSLILDSHENFDLYVERFDIGIFNLGYLPNGNHQITTMANITIKTLKKALLKINNKGTIYLVIYIGHDQGKQESLEIEEYIQQLNHKHYNIASFKMLNKKNAPYVIEIEKIAINNALLY